MREKKMAHRRTKVNETFPFYEDNAIKCSTITSFGKMTKSIQPSNKVVVQVLESNISVIARIFSVTNLYPNTMIILGTENMLKWSKKRESNTAWDMKIMSNKVNLILLTRHSRIVLKIRVRCPRWGRIHLLIVFPKNRVFILLFILF